ncbi:MAG: GNAT family N-acetyltransferase [Spirochaetota bacterium]
MKKKMLLAQQDSLLQNEHYFQLGTHMHIRHTTAEDEPRVIQVHLEAFGQQHGPEIAGLVKDLLHDQTAQPMLSLAAEQNGELVGHVLFSRAELAEAGQPVSVRILAPLAVIPEHQSTGVGTLLISHGLEMLRQGGVDLVFVLGHPDYYPRSGFTPAGVRGLEAPYPIPGKDADAWMVQELRPGILGKVQGTVRCCEALDKPEHWRE